MNKLFFIFSILAATAQAADSDFLAQQALEFRAQNPDSTFRSTISDLRGVFANFQPGLDSTMRVVKPVRVSGSSESPTVQVTLEKCVLFICQTVDFHAQISVRDSSGRCRMNYSIESDLSRSGDALTEVYDRLSVSVCYNSSGSTGSVQAQAFAHHAPSYSGGITQGVVKGVLEMQVEPIARSMLKALKKNAD